MVPVSFGIERGEPLARKGMELLPTRLRKGIQVPICDEELVLSFP